MGDGYPIPLFPHPHNYWDRGILCDTVRTVINACSIVNAPHNEYKVGNEEYTSWMKCNVDLLGVNWYVVYCFLEHTKTHIG